VPKRDGKILFGKGKKGTNHRPRKNPTLPMKQSHSMNPLRNSGIVMGGKGMEGMVGKILMGLDKGIDIANEMALQLDGSSLQINSTVEERILEEDGENEMLKKI
jgi:hypothetical protein